MYDFWRPHDVATLVSMSVNVCFYLTQRKAGQIKTNKITLTNFEKVWSFVNNFDIFYLLAAFILRRQVKYNIRWQRTEEKEEHSIRQISPY